jgi:hypothetical protein
MPTPKTKRLADYQNKHDKSVTVPRAIRDTLAAMAKEAPDAWEYDADFLRRAGVAQSEIGAYRDQFADHIVMTGGKQTKRVWVATAKEAKKFRDTAGAR